MEGLHIKNKKHKTLKLEFSLLILVKDWESEIGDAKKFVRKLNVISKNKDKEPEEKEQHIIYLVAWKIRNFWSSFG